MSCVFGELAAVTCYSSVLLSEPQAAASRETPPQRNGLSKKMGLLRNVT